MNLKVITALISISNKENLVSLLKTLKKFNINILSSGGTYAAIKKLGYKDVSTARASVSRIRKSGRSHAHKIQAAVSMEQRAKAAGKSKEAAVFRRNINANKKGKK